MWFRFRIAGQQDRQVLYLVTDKDIKDDVFLEYINNLLTVGELPHLFSKEELEAIVGDLRIKFNKVHKGVPDTYENLYRFFLTQARNNIHVVLCFSPVGDGLRGTVVKCDIVFSIFKY